MDGGSLSPLTGALGAFPHRLGFQPLHRLPGDRKRIRRARMSLSPRLALSPFGPGCEHSRRGAAAGPRLTCGQSILWRNCAALTAFLWATRAIGGTRSVRIPEDHLQLTALSWGQDLGMPLKHS